MIEKMNAHYSLTNPASVYDEEALTALELAGRTAAKMNQTVDSFNALEKDTKNRLDEQDLEISDRMNTQDENITRMNDVTMPEKVKNEVQRRIDNGDFDSSIDAHLGNLEERVNNLVGSASEGSTTLDMELLDLRVSENGETFPSAGESVRSEFSKVNNVLRVTPVWIDSTYLYASSGREQHIESGVYACTDFIPIPAVLKTIGVRAVTAEDSSGFCFYDANKNYLSGMNIGAGSNVWVDKVLNVPEGARFVRYSCFTNNGEKAYSYLYFTDGLNTLLATEEKEEEFLEIEIVKNQYLTSKGTVVEIENENFVTAEMDVKPFQTFKLTSGSVDGSRQYAVKSGTGEILDVFPKENQRPASIQTVTFTIPEGGTKLIMGGYNSGINIVEVVNTNLINERLEILQNEVEELKVGGDGFYKYAFENVLCIGDSLTAGACYIPPHTGESIALNYPYYLGKMLSCTVTNGGKSGWSASKWHERLLTFYNYSGYDGFVIWLGTNYGCTSMPTDEEINSFMPDYTETAEEANQALYLIDIIKTIKEKNPKGVIFLCTVFASKSNTDTNNQVVRQIAEKYNLPVIDMSDLGADNHPELHGGITNPHFGKAGNIYIANRITTNIAEYFNNDPLRAEFGY